MNRQAFAALAEQVALAKLISDPASLGKIYERMVGYDLHEDDPSMSADDLRGMIMDMAREICCSCDVPCGQVGLL